MITANNQILDDDSSIISYDTVKVSQTIGNYPIYMYLHPSFEIPSLDKPTIRKGTDEAEIKSSTEVLSDEEVIKQSKNYFQRNYDELLLQYNGNYIAILLDKVIDIDSDFGKLAQKVYKEHGYKTVFITRVDNRVNMPNLKAPSPHIKKS